MKNSSLWEIKNFFFLSMGTIAAFPSVISHRSMFKEKKTPTKGLNQAILLNSINAKYANVHLTDH